MENKDQDEKDKLEVCAGNHTKRDLGIYLDPCPLCGCIMQDDENCFNQNQKVEDENLKKAPSNSDTN